MAHGNRKTVGLAEQVPRTGYGFLKAVLDRLSACSEELAAELDRPTAPAATPATRPGGCSGPTSSDTS